MDLKCRSLCVCVRHTRKQEQESKKAREQESKRAREQENNTFVRVKDRERSQQNNKK